MAAAAAAIHKANQTKKAAKQGGHHSPKKEELQVCELEVPAAKVYCVGFWKYQKQAEDFYNSTPIQVTTAGLIGANFAVNILQAEIDPKGLYHVEGFAFWEWFFNVAFLIELIVNMYGTWCCKFWQSGWNIFDFLVVTIGWMFQLQLPLPGPMKLLRMMRAFRVFRLFKRIESLRKILNSLGNAVPGVMNAFLIQFIVVCIFAIIGVDRFRDYGEGGFMINEMGNRVELITARQQDFGFEYFGDFGKSLYTMFQVLTTESWAEAVTRPMFNSQSPTTSTGSAFFMVLFCVLNGIILLNVVVAVLLEKMVDEVPDAEDPIKVSMVACHEQVTEMTNNMDGIAEATYAMQRQIFDVVALKDQVEAMLIHAGLEVAPRLPPPKLPVAFQGLGSDDCVALPQGPPAMEPDRREDCVVGVQDLPDGIPMDISSPNTQKQVISFETDPEMPSTDTDTDAMSPTSKKKVVLFAADPDAHPSDRTTD